MDILDLEWMLSFWTCLRSTIHSWYNMKYWRNWWHKYCKNITVSSTFFRANQSVNKLIKLLNFSSVIQTVSVKRQFVANFGLNTFLETEWVRLRVPSLLRTFWLARFTQQLLGKIETDFLVLFRLQTWSKFMVFVLNVHLKVELFASCSELMYSFMLN